MTQRIEGGCFCGSVRYSLEKNNYRSSNCHCSMCRRISGAAFVSWMAIPIRCFEYIQGEPKKLISSSHGTRYFCQDCGTPVVCLLEEYPEYTYITICSLDRPQDFEPKGDMYTEDRLPWLKKTKS
tara:strand:- start:109475 stop:109849 length:375 start_codon:yes stop_codon:yes gene_type:complete